MSNQPRGEQLDILPIAESFETTYGKQLGLEPGFADRAVTERYDAKDIAGIDKVLRAAERSDPEHKDPRFKPFYELQSRASVVRAKVSERLSTRAAASAPGQNPGLTWGEVPDEKKRDAVKLLQGKLSPVVLDHGADRNACIDALIAQLAVVIYKEKGGVELVQGLFANFSNEESALRHPLHLIGEAFLAMTYPDRNFPKRYNPHFANWAQAQGPRLKWLEANVHYTYALESVPSFLQAFEAAHKDPRRDKARLAAELAFKLKDDLEKFPDTLTMMANCLHAEATLTPAQRLIGQEIVRQMKPLVRENRLKPEMRAAVSPLSKKLRRIALAAALLVAPSHSSPTQAVQRQQVAAQDQDFADFDKHLDAYQAQKAAAPKVAEQPQVKKKKSPQELADERRQEAAGNSLAEMIKDPKRKKEFIALHLGPAIKEQGLRLNIDPDRSTLKLLGAGGMSVVIEAYDMMLNQKVALRFDVDGLSSPENAQLAMRGVALHSKLSHHPHIVKSHDFGSITIGVDLEDGKPLVPVSMMFQKLELLEGNIQKLDKEKLSVREKFERLEGNISLDKLIRSFLEPEGSGIGVPSPDAVRSFFHKIMSAFAYCHGMGIVHRDIKPDNIMLRIPPNWKRGDISDLLHRGQPKIIDFGLARDTAEQDSVLTYAQGVLGTLPFVSPEALNDAILTRNPSSDIWSLAVTMWQVIAGKVKTRHPYNSSYGGEDFKADDFSLVNWAGSVGRLSPKTHAKPMVDPEGFDLEAFRKQVNDNTALVRHPEFLLSMLSAMTYLDPEKRPTAAQLLDFLENPDDRFSEAHKPKAAAKPRQVSSRVKAAEPEEQDDDGGDGVEVDDDSDGETGIVATLKRWFGISRS